MRWCCCRKCPGRIFPRGHGNGWPAYRYEWHDLLSMLDDQSGEAMKLLAEERNHVKIPPSSTEISNMEAALGWQGDYLHGCDPALTRGFNLCGLAAARECSVDDIVRHGRHAGALSPTRWRELGLAAASRIAHGLTADRVGVF